ncbi:hypothetical protein ASL14_06235 [Paenibacillus sp. IHB B 3084]|uniref:restriction endonuclease n=1 Tax=Paenibacillus sp. IHB B 3084 TaxID=867076 RepID=UPI000721B824|nr:restriction endonuclease [Paenibacillus sp. IHB B 3084]ALP35827.1 hypothetical protein ASL14_06235 [Paenibacillus sp. IHB B 3084]
MRILESHPSDWKDLEVKVGKILNASGFIATVNKQIKTVRGRVNVDVYAEDVKSIPKSINLFECKYWSADIPQAVIHSFRTVLNDFGANSGFIIVKNGFQSGAYDAVKNTNVHLLSWNEFQDVFIERWLECTLDILNEIGLPLREYTDPLDMDKFYEKASDDDKEIYKNLCVKYVGVALYSSKFFYQFQSGVMQIKKEQVDQLIDKAIKEKLLGITRFHSYSDYFEFLQANCLEGMREFELLFEKYN